ncbi:MAG: hypothetical protein COB83_13110 [Gammaproteobacteria bacterium]|nr:MAG: hypothetical protein COB83_13110 [Gammaproteobacteria bacterium]
MNVKKTNIKIHQNFDVFLNGESNKAANQAAVDYTSQLGNQQKWLWLYSGTGLGKTHLLHAIGNKLCDKHPNIKIKQIHTETFCLSLTKAMQEDKLHQFIKSYQDLDCLLLDGMTFHYMRYFYSNHHVRKVLYTILVSLKKSKSLVVFTSDSVIQQSPRMNIKRLLNRCKQVSLSRPETSLKKRVAHQTALERGFKLSNEILTFISQQNDDNILEIKGVIWRIISEVKGTGELLSLNVVKRLYYMKVYSCCNIDRVNRQDESMQSSNGR